MLHTKFLKVPDDLHDQDLYRKKTFFGLQIYASETPDVFMIKIHIEKKTFFGEKKANLNVCISNLFY
jgi:hypothetical protein